MNLVDALRGTRTPSGGRGRLRAALLVTQVALSFVLLVSSGLLFRSLRNAAAPEPGVDAARVAIASFGNLRSFGYDVARVEQFHREWLAAVRTLPGVEQAALASFVGERRFRVPGRTDDDNLTIRAGVVSDGYFATMGQAIIAGQAFPAPTTVPVAIVNEALATRYFPDEIAIGRRVGLGEDFAEHEIIGVVQAVARQLARRRPSAVGIPSGRAEHTARPHVRRGVSAAGDDSAGWTWDRAELAAVHGTHGRARDRVVTGPATGRSSGGHDSWRHRAIAGDRRPVRPANLQPRNAPEGSRHPSRSARQRGRCSA